MSTSQLYHTQGIEHFQHINHSYAKGFLIWTIQRKENSFKCYCGSSQVTATPIRRREIKGLSMGKLKTLFNVITHRLRCHDCGAYRMEKLDFLPTQKSSFTRAVARYAIELRREMTIIAVAKHTNLDWHTVKEIEKAHLQRKYKNIKLKEVKAIGIDEVHIGEKGFLVIVRDLTSGAVLFVGDGKSAESLDPFTKRLRRAKCKLETIAVDLASSFTKWAKETAPNATIVYDKFHVIKLMNDKLNAVRRTTMNKLEDDEKKALKGKRHTLLRNIEDITEEAKKDLDKIRKTYHNLGEMSLMKECLRNIYIIAEWEDEARIAFMRWCTLAKEIGVTQLKTMAKTIASKLDGIIAFWKDKITSASMEGFNNKIGWLNRQAYGYRDMEYFKLKIYDLPKLKIENSL